MQTNYGQDNFSGIYFTALCPSTPNLMRTGVAVTWGGTEFPNLVLLQPVNSSVIPVLSEEKNLLPTEFQMATQK